MLSSTEREKECQGTGQGQAYSTQLSSLGLGPHLSFLHLCYTFALPTAAGDCDFPVGRDHVLHFAVKDSEYSVEEDVVSDFEEITR